MKEKLYKKEILLTIVFIVLLFLMGYTILFFVAFPGLRVGTMWGFPTHYIIPVLTGWFGVMIVCWFMAYFCNKLDDEIEALSEGGSVSSEKEVN